MPAAALPHRSVSTLSDVLIRPGSLRDTDAVQAMHRRCSATSLQHRFNAPAPRVSTRMVQHLLAPTAGWSLVAQCDDAVVALACAAPVSASDVEVGVLVEDRHQRRGVGSRMLHEIARQASARGFLALELFARPGNDRVAATVHRSGLTCRVTWQGDLLRYSLSVRRPAGVDVEQPDGVPQSA